MDDWERGFLLVYTAYTILAGLVQQMGEEQAFDYLKKLHRNVTSYTRSGTAQAPNVAKGEVAVGISFGVVEVLGPPPLQVQRLEFGRHHFPNPHPTVQHQHHHRKRPRAGRRIGVDCVQHLRHFLVAQHIHKHLGPLRNLQPIERVGHLFAL